MSFFFTKTKIFRFPRLRYDQKTHYHSPWGSQCALEIDATFFIKTNEQKRPFGKMWSLSREEVLPGARLGE